MLRQQLTEIDAMVWTSQLNEMAILDALRVADKVVTRVVCSERRYVVTAMIEAMRSRPRPEDMANLGAGIRQNSTPSIGETERSPCRRQLFGLC